MEKRITIRQSGLDEYHKLWHTNDADMIIFGFI